MSSADIFEYRAGEYRIVRVFSWNGVMLFKRARTAWLPIPVDIQDN